ncbi:MAG: tRNA (adenosine(37)-N6)-threonylcarbamoyltransferase complex ATPase subunit type 1 TsaE [Acidimicrobiales bacterium]
MSWRRYCATSDDTKVAGEEFASVLRPGDVILLSGQLGAGKTTFAQGVARGLGVVERVTSPTFTMVRQHECANDRGITTLHHADVYRVGTLDEVVDLALGELVEESAVALVEWGEIASSVFGLDVMSVDFSDDQYDGRVLEVTGALTEGREDELNVWATP